HPADADGAARATAPDGRDSGALTFPGRKEATMIGYRLQRVAGVVVLTLLFASSALAADGIVVSRGEDSTMFGVCVPSMTVENRSSQTIDFLQVDLLVNLANGRERTVELQSAYRTGIVLPIAPGAKATLRQHLDLGPSLGLPCSDVKTRKIARIVC